MALIKCYECGAEISDAAKSCPKCGAPQPKPAIVEEPTPASAPSEEIKDRKYYFKRIGGIIGILIAGKIISKIILALLK